MKGYNKSSGRRTIHLWKADPTPLNPTLMRSLCGRAYAFHSSIQEVTPARQGCKGCAKHSNGEAKP